MEYCKSAWIHTDFTPATCVKCGRFVFVLNNSQHNASECFACQSASTIASCSVTTQNERTSAQDSKRLTSVTTNSADKITHIASDTTQLDTARVDKQTPERNREKKKKLTKQRRTPPIANEQFEEDVDSETSSVHSNSSASKASSRRKSHRRGRRHCPIHGSRRLRKDDDTGEVCADSVRANEDAGKSRRLLPLDCLCRSKVSTSSRPEPEGRQAPVMDDNDWVIYNNEPLFSDVDDSHEVEEQIRLDAERHHRRVDSQAENLFSAAQMVNTNTMLKFAIIQAELKNMDLCLRKTRIQLMKFTRDTDILGSLRIPMHLRSFRL